MLGHSSKFFVKSMYLKIFDESLQEGDEMLGPPDVSWYGLLKKILGKGYGMVRHHNKSEKKK
jgi:hypothetical protein